MKIKHYSVILILAALVGLFGCNKPDVNEPVPQQILYSDTSGTTGELTVYVLYDDGFGNYPKAYGSNIFLYATYDDILHDLDNSSEDLAIYRLNTGLSDNIAYFGFINYGNYYVLAFNTIQEKYYQKVSIVQVRPLQDEKLTITMDEVETQ